MNRCMYNSNCQNQMANSQNRPMCRPVQNNSCRGAQPPQPMPCRREPEPPKPAPCRREADSQSPAPCRREPEPPKPAPCKCETEPSRRPSCREENRPRPSRSQLLQHINEVSFAVNDIILYLDSHPCDGKAMEFYEENVKKRNKALREYAKYYGPLTIDTADDAQSNSWEWISQPWPWEGGNC